MKTQKRNNNSSHVNVLFASAKEGYEGKVVAEAVQRAGRNPHIKGVIHEVLHRDAFNANPLNIIKGEQARLVESTTAKTVDTVVMKGGKVVQRLQLKDTPASMSKTLKQIHSGQYRSAQVVGTRETVAKAVGKTAKQVRSSGISSETTARIAAKTGNTGSVLSGASRAARAGGFAGGAISGGLALGKGVIDLANGERDLGEVAVDVAKETVGGGLAGGAASAAGALATTSAVAAVGAFGVTGLAATVTVVAAPLVVGVAVGYGVKSLWDALFD